MGDPVGMGDPVATGDWVGAGVRNGVATGDWLGDAVGLTVGGAVGGAGAELIDWATGLAWMIASARLSFVSVPFPAAAPGLRSRLEPAIGAGPAAPSTKALAASPQLRESTTDPPSVRRTMLPPDVANPPV